jgi:hypothetical protein
MAMTEWDVTKEEEELFKMTEDEYLNKKESSSSESPEPDDVDEEYDDNDLDQPDDDENSHEESNNDEADDDSEEVDEPVSKDTPDEEKDGDNQSKEEVKAEESKVKEGAEKLKPLKIAGKEIPIDNIDELYTLAQQGLDYTRKTSAIAPYRRMISAIEENKLGEEDVYTLIDALKGNKDAIAHLAKRSGVDIDEIDSKVEGFKPNQYGKSGVELQLQETVRELQSDPVGKELLSFVDKEFDDASLDVIRKDPSILKGLSADKERGLFDELYPLAQKLKLLDGSRSSDIDYYVQAARQHATKVNNTTKDVQQPEPKRDPNQDNVDRQARRKAATQPRRKASVPKVTDYLDAMDDEQYKSWAKKVEESMQR